MSPVVNQFSLFFFLITILSSQAREGQFFNKVSNDVVPLPKQPDFLPDTESRFGLYGKDSGETTLPSAVAQPPPKYLPKNYNPVSYVTEPEQRDESANIPSIPTTNKLSGGEQNYRLTPEEQQAEYRNSHYNGGGGDLAKLSSGLNSVGAEKNYRLTPDEQRAEYRNRHYNGGAGDIAKLSGGLKSVGGEQNYGLTPEEQQAEYRNSHYNGGGGDLAKLSGGGGVAAQGMSDTRLFENGKYHYDVNSEKFNGNHPYETARNGNYYGNGENGYKLNGVKNSVVAGYEFDGSKNAVLAGYEFNGGKNSVVGGYEEQNDDFQQDEQP